MHSVTLAGKVESMHAHPPTPAKSKPFRTLYGIAEFVLVDDTGSLPVETLGSCFAAAMELPHDGDLIEVTAVIQAFVPDSETAQVIKAFTQEIVILKTKDTGEESGEVTGGTFQFSDTSVASQTHLTFLSERFPHSLQSIAPSAGALYDTPLTGQNIPSCSIL